VQTIRSSRKMYRISILVLVLLTMSVLSLGQDYILAKGGETAEEPTVRTLEIEQGQILYLSREGSRIFFQGEEVALKREEVPYELPATAFNYWQDGDYAQLVYPLLISRTGEDGVTDHLVYHLAEEKVLITAEEFREELSADWERVTGGEPLMIMDYEIEAQDFTDSLLAKLSPDGQMVYLSLQHYMIATMRNAVAVMERDSGEINFVPEIIQGGVSNVFWSPEGEHFGLITTDARGYSSLYIVDADKLDIITRFPDYHIPLE